MSRMTNMLAKKRTEKTENKKRFKSRIYSFTWSSFVLLKKTSSAIEAGDSEKEDPVPLGS